MIVSFKDTETEDMFHGHGAKRARRFPPDITGAARRKLDMLNAAHTLDDMKIPPGNRLKSLRGKLSGFYSIRVNDQWRITFQWKDGNAREVSLTDYH